MRGLIKMCLFIRRVPRIKGNLEQKIFKKRFVLYYAKNFIVQYKFKTTSSNIKLELLKHENTIVRIRDDTNHLKKDTPFEKVK